MILSPADLVELTGKERHNAQARELDHLGIAWKRRRDGSLVVFKSDCGGAASGSIKREPRLRLANGPTP